MWEGVTKRTFIYAWKKRWPKSVVEWEGFETVPVEPAVHETVSLVQIMGLEEEIDSDELEGGHSQELSTEKLTELQCFTARSYGGELARGGGGNQRENLAQ
ncbi:hypothetical protein AVEN_30986-1 [Araneus ventricosus]|uniref:Uncharacterized protein n=1 Tax=Araneus ventricosus TaxID=182803 RepID=A0A4Y2KJI0_ARAVE|nr:hypothetical protein AVEN_30986-1 [Araneus ventricosus]